MSHPTLDASVRNILFRCTGIPAEDIEPDHELSDDLGMDSVAQMEMIGMFAEDLDIEVDLEATMHVRTVRDVVELARQTRGTMAGA